MPAVERKDKDDLTSLTMRVAEANKEDGVRFYDINEDQMSLGMYRNCEGPD